MRVGHFGSFRRHSRCRSHTRNPWSPPAERTFVCLAIRGGQITDNPIFFGRAGEASECN